MPLRWSTPLADATAYPRMHVYREVWVRNLLDRETRLVDMQIMASLQNGTAFFASTSLIALGGGLALLCDNSPRTPGARWASKAFSSEVKKGRQSKRF
jgi:Protein of unknown function, DUF599